MLAYPLVFVVLTSMLWSNSGHGGSRTAEYLKNNLFKNLSSHPDFIKDPKTAIGMKLVDFCFIISVEYHLNYLTLIMI